MIGLFGESVTITSGSATTTVRGCSVQGQSSVEPRDGSSLRITTDMVVYVPAGTVVRAGDTMTVRGLEYQVEGEPIPETNVFTGTAGMVPVTVRRTTG